MSITALAKGDNNTQRSGFAPVFLLLGIRLLLLLVPYEISRLIYYIYNRNFFGDIDFSRLSWYMLAGLRFDVSAIIATNLIFILLSLTPFWNAGNIYRKYILKMIYIIVNGFVMFSQLCDAIFHPFVYKRSTADIFKFLSLGNDTENVMPTVMKDYWYMFFVWGGLIAITWVLYNRTEKQSPAVSTRKINPVSYSAYLFLSGILLFLGYRGGLQAKPLSIADSVRYSNANDMSLVINTPFSIINSFDAPDLDDFHFFNPDSLRRLYSIRHEPSKGNFRKLNVVTIILESFSKEYIGAINNRHGTNTPFLDSLITQSFICDNAFSDGKKSIEGIPAVVAGIPSWMDMPFIISSFRSDSISSMASLLKKEGYVSAFFHGGNNGSMGFDMFCKNAGFNYYYGRNEYHNDKDYDGTWGIWDVPFFQYFKRMCDTLPQPFYSAIFSLSSHHPFSIPRKYKEKFKQEGKELPILKCVRYSDYALKEFFEAASHSPWFDSTLFVITADHTGPSADKFYTNRLGMFEIPIIFYQHHSGLRGVTHHCLQHIDILPSVMDYLRYPHSYHAFGVSVFDSAKGGFLSINYINHVYQAVHAPYCLQMEDGNVTALYNFWRDSLLTDNLLDKLPKVKDSLSGKMKAVLQTYSTGLIHNRVK